MKTGSMMNHWGLFLTTVLAQGSDEQMVTWALRAFTMKILGCYAQTELGESFHVCVEDDIES